jgi:H+-transporting ATPase
MQKGISAAEVQKRRAAFGFNELESPKENLFIKFIGFFRGPILYGE